MRLRTQVLCAVTASVAVLAALLLALNGVLTLHRFHLLEQEQMRSQVDRLEATLVRDGEELSIGLGDWSSWDECWRFVNGTYPEFPKQQITPTAFVGGDIERMLFIDVHGTVVFTADAEDRPLGEAARSAELTELVRTTARLRPTTGEDGVQGLITLDAGLVLYAARPILHSDGSGPPAGTLAWIRALDSNHLESLQKRMRSQANI
ncbi:MAG TPA: CHASE4 domain-containing protein [Planctomycetota bacterium]|nr:CHASE4 domain-containing protein [Planctomycetota bacterium]